MSGNVDPLGITAAALVMQLFLSVILAVGTLWFGQRESRVFGGYEDAGIGRYSWIVLVFALTTVGFLIFSDRFSGLWQGLASGVNFAIVRWTTAIFVVFALNIAFVAIFVGLTGGSYRSPFTAVYFILPALAFFLREPLRRIVLYTVVISLLFLAGLRVDDEKTRDTFLPTGPYAFVSISCLVLSVLVGYLTRPR